LDLHPATAKVGLAGIPSLHGKQWISTTAHSGCTAGDMRDDDHIAEAEAALARLDEAHVTFCA